MSRRTIAAVLTALTWSALPGPVAAGPGDAFVKHNLALAARARGDVDEAYGLFKEACMAADALAEACLAWGELAIEREDEKDVKRALSSAVMLDPENLGARFALAVYLLGKKDYTWAIEHLEQAVPLAADAADRAILRYYLGYALFKEGELEAAAKQLSLSRLHLPPDLQQRCDYYRGLIAEARDKRFKAASLLLEASEGPDEEWADAAQSRLESGSSFPRRPGFGGQVSASLGVNTHPASAFLDDPEAEDTLPVLQSVIRGDAVYSAGNYSHGFQAMLTAYREQNWTELGKKDEEGDPPSANASTGDDFSPQDFSVTLFLAQVGYLLRGWLDGREHELLIGVDGETQFLDHLPERTADGTYERSADPFGLNAFAVGGKVWWAVAASPDAEYGLRLKVEGRPNYIDANRSTVRTRLRFVHTRHFLERALRLKLLVGGRYDIAYHDPEVVKYDRLLPELEANLRWRTPVEWLSAVFYGKLKYNWYLNSRENADNSFRPPYIPAAGIDEDEAERQEAEYYDLTRHDLEWELGAEVLFSVWRLGTVALTYRYHQRASNMDDAPTPIYEGERLPAPTYGYDQHVVMLELRQGF
jgi:tetratricopeptide (TPR) repeat protein